MMPPGFVYSQKIWKKVSLCQTKTAILYAEYKNISIIKKEFHEIHAIVNTPGGVAHSRFALNTEPDIDNSR